MSGLYVTEIYSTNKYTQVRLKVKLGGIDIQVSHFNLDC